jgi:hypothetical protein
MRYHLQTASDGYKEEYLSPGVIGTGSQLSCLTPIFANIVGHQGDEFFPNFFPAFLCAQFSRASLAKHENCAQRKAGKIVHRGRPGRNWGKTHRPGGRQYSRK